MIKPAKYVKLYGVEIEYEKNMTDQEVRLYHLLLRLVVWDQKHTENFGSVRLTVRDISKIYLPWSPAKVNNVINSLINRGYLSRRQDKRLAIKNYEAYRARSVQMAETIIHARERIVKTMKQDVQQDEIEPSQNDNKQSQENEGLRGKDGFSVQPDKHD